MRQPGDMIRKAYVRQTIDRRRKTGDLKQTGNRKYEIVYRRHEKVPRCETGDRSCETGDVRKETLNTETGDIS